MTLPERAPLLVVPAPLLFQVKPNFRPPSCLSTSWVRPNVYGACLFLSVLFCPYVGPDRTFYAAALIHCLPIKASKQDSLQTAVPRGDAAAAGGLLTAFQGTVLIFFFLPPSTWQHWSKFPCKLTEKKQASKWNC